MHKRKDYYHAGGNNGNKSGFYWGGKHIEPLILTNIKRDPEPYQSQPPDEKPSLLTRFTNFLKNRKA